MNVSQWLAINASAAAASMLPISSSNAGSMPRAATSDPNLLRCFMLSSVGPWQVLMSDPALQWLVPSCSHGPSVSLRDLADGRMGQHRVWIRSAGPSAWWSLEATALRTQALEFL